MSAEIARTNLPPTFTLGHRAVIEEAARNSDEVVIFAVQEDRSAIPFSDRFALMKQGVADLRNVVVISGGDYIVSNATFPTYFIKGTDELAAQTRLDVASAETQLQSLILPKQQKKTTTL